MKTRSARKRRTRLERARDEVLPVRFGRKGLQPHREAGMVLDLSDEWLLLGILDDGVVGNGYSFFRISDITHVQIQTTFLPVLRNRPDWPHNPPERVVDLSGTRELLTSFAESEDVITIHREATRPDTCWLGIPAAIRRKKTWFRTIDPDGRWEDVEIELRYRDITRADFGDAYTQAISTLARPCV